MATYDYELARHAYERALASSGGDAAAAEAMLGLLVEHLAAYPEAVALWPACMPGWLPRSSVFAPRIRRASPSSRQGFKPICRRSIQRGRRP
jgi:hypothetical protein